MFASFGSPEILNGDNGEMVEFPNFAYEQDNPYTTQLLNNYNFGKCFRHLSNCRHLTGPKLSLRQK